MFSQTDFSVQHKYKFGRDNKYAIAAHLNIINLFDQDTITGYYNDLSNASLLSNSTSVNNFGCPLVDGHIDYPCVINKFNSGALQSALGALIDGANGRDARYGSASAFQGPVAFASDSASCSSLKIVSNLSARPVIGRAFLCLEFRSAASFHTALGRCPILRVFQSTA